jgi:hypothetical protein
MDPGPSSRLWDGWTPDEASSGSATRCAGREWLSRSGALLRHLEAVGFHGAPLHLGVDVQGRDVLSWVEGDVPVPPYPGWALTDVAIESLGRLVRGYDEAVASFDAGGSTGWSAEWSDPAAGGGVPQRPVPRERGVP